MKLLIVFSFDNVHTLKKRLNSFCKNEYQEDDIHDCKPYKLASFLFKYSFQEFLRVSPIIYGIARATHDICD